MAHAYGLTAWVVAAGAVAASAAAQAPPSRLVPGTAVEQRVSGLEPLSFRVDASADDTVRVHVHQLGVDVALVLQDAAGTTLAVADTVGRPFGSERLTVDVPSSGAYRLVVRPTDGVDRSGRVRVRLEPARPATPADRQSAAAERRLHAVLDAPWPSEPPSRADRRARMEAVDLVAHAFDAAGDAWGRAVALSARSLVAVESEFWDDVEPGLAQAVALWRRLDDPPSLAHALNLRALSLEATGHMADAAPLAREAYTVALAAGDLPMASLVANNLGIVHDSLGDAEAAYDAFTEALALRTRAGRGISEAAVLLNLARVATNLGALDEARALHERVRPMLTGPANLSRARIAANNYGNLLRRLGDFEAARRMHEESLELGRRLQSASGEAQALNGLGTDLFEMGRHAEAEDYQRRSVAIRRTLRDPSGLAAVLQNLGHTVSTLGRHDEAIELLRESLAIRERIADVRALPGAWQALSRAERARGRLDDALAAAERSIVLVEGLRDQLTAPSLRASFVAREHASYELAIDLLMTAFVERGDPAFEQRAFELADRARARTLLDALLTSRVDVRTGVAPSLLDEARRLEQAADAASTRLSRLLAQPAAEADVAAARETLARAAADLERHQARMLRDSPAYASLVRPAPTPLAVVRDELLDADTVLLQFTLGDERGWAWAVSREGVRSVPLPGRAAIAAAVRALREHYEARAPRAGEAARAAAQRIARADAALPEAGAALSALVLAPFEAELGGPWRGRRLAVVASDALEYVPFGALPLPGTSTRMLERHELVMLPSASALRAIRQQRPAVRTTPPRVAVVADPVFERADPRLARVGAPAIATPAVQAPARPARPDPAARGAASPVGLSRLVFSRLEATAIARLVPAARVSVATGFDASRETVTSGGLASADIVHFATHGLVSPDRPAATGLVMSLLDRRGRPQDGFLRLGDIYNLDLNADLVVLSACQTALGTEIRGEGLVGLTRGFMYAGARRVVATLWAVDDSATSALMARFYRGMLRERLSPPAALRAAQRHIASQPQWAAPYYWAGVILQGDWR